MTKVGNNSTVSLIKKKMASLEEGVQGVSHLSEALLPSVLKLGLGDYPEIPHFKTSRPFPSKLLRQKIKQFLKNIFY